MDAQNNWWGKFDESQYKELVHSEGIDIRGLTFDEVGAEIALRAVPDQEMYFQAGDTLWDRVRREFRSLICEKSEKYKELRETASKLGAQSATSLIAVVSAGLGATVGVISTVIAPLVALLLLAVTRLGVGLFCSEQFLEKKVD